MFSGKDNLIPIKDFELGSMAFISMRTNIIREGERLENISSTNSK